MIYIALLASFILQCLLLLIPLHCCEQHAHELEDITTRLCACAHTELPPTKCLHYARYHPTDNHLRTKVLCDAITRRDKKAIEFFCTHHAACVNGYDCYGQAPLFIAAQLQDLDTMRMLLDAHADPQQLSVIYADHPRTWYVPHLYSRKKVRQSMMQKAQRATCSFALERMVQANNLPGVVMLLQAGADPNYLASRPCGGLLEHVTSAALVGMKKAERKTARTILSTLLQYGAGTNRTCVSHDYELECGAALIRNTVKEGRNTKELMLIEPGIVDLYNTLHRLISYSRDYNRQVTDAMHKKFIAVKRIFEAHTWNNEDTLAALYCFTNRAIDMTFIRFFGTLLLKDKKMPCSIYKGQSLLNMAVDRIHLGLIECLLAWGACPNEADTWGNYPLNCVQGSTPLYYVNGDFAQENLYKILIAGGASVWKKSNQKVDAHIEALVKKHACQNTPYFFPQWKAFCTALCINSLRNSKADPNYMCAQQGLAPLPALPIELCAHICSYMQQKTCPCKKEPKHPVLSMATDSVSIEQLSDMAHAVELHDPYLTKQNAAPSKRDSKQGGDVCLLS